MLPRETLQEPDSVEAKITHRKSQNCKTFPASQLNLRAGTAGGNWQRWEDADALRTRSANAPPRWNSVTHSRADFLVCVSTYPNSVATVASGSRIAGIWCPSLCFVCARSISHQNESLYIKSGSVKIWQWVHSLIQKQWYSHGDRWCG